MSYVRTLRNGGFVQRVEHTADTLSHGVLVTASLLPYTEGRIGNARQCGDVCPDLDFL